MHVSMQDIGTDATHLSECRYALMLSVQTPENRLEDFLKFSCAILDVQNSLLMFENEPCAWHSSPEGLVIVTEPLMNFSIFSFQGSLVFQENHQFFSVLFREYSENGDHLQPFNWFSIAT